MAKAETTRRMLLSSIGSQGLKESGGFVLDEFLIRLRGRNGIKLYREMSENNAVIGSILYIIDMLVRQVDWRVETPPGLEEEPSAIKEKEFLEGVLTDMNHTWEDFISEVISMLVYGWSYFEIVYKLRKGNTANKQTRSKFNDGRYGWRKIEIRAQETLWNWAFDEEGGLDGMRQSDNYRPTGSSNIFIPIEKSILFRTKSSKGNPEGKPLLRPAVRSWVFVKGIQDDEAIGISRDLTGMPIFEVPAELLSPDASAEDKSIRSQLETMIQQIRIDERWGGLIPPELDSEGKPTGFKFRLQTTGGRRMIPTNDIIKRYESRMAMVFLAEFIMIGMDKVGTESLHAGKSSMFKLSMETILNDMIASTFNRFGIGRLMSLNRVPQELWPVIVPGDLDTPDLEKMGNYMTSLAQAGILSPNKPLENKLLADADLPIPSNDEEDVFSDLTTPTPRETSDQSSGILSPSQIEAVMNINRAIKRRELTSDAARELAAASLGMEASSVDRFLIAEPEATTLLPPKPPDVVADGQVKPPGSLPSDDDLPTEPR